MQAYLDCSSAPAADENFVIQRIYERHAKLLGNLLCPLGIALDNAEFPRLVALGAPESAVLKMLEGPTGYMASRGPDGMCFASICLKGAEREVSETGSTLALALLAALFLGLIQLSDHCLEKCEAWQR